MKRWSWFLAILAGISLILSAGCEDDDDGDAPAGGSNTNAPSGGTGGGSGGGGTGGGGTGGSTSSNSTGVTLNTNLVINFNTNLTLPSLQIVLLDKRVIVTDAASATVTANAAPAAGTVKVTATWTTEDLMAGGAPIDIPLEFWLNQGGSGGSLHNAGHKSPWSGAVSVPAGQAVKIQVINNVVKSRATVNVKAVYTKN